MHSLGAVGAIPAGTLNSWLTLKEQVMPQANLLDEVGAKVREILAASPAKDIEKNLRTMLARVFDRLDLATREELDVQERVLARTREKLSKLEARVAELEAKLKQR
jgi:ubiquinone biosynthesis accessory factor UbiK